MLCTTMSIPLAHIEGRENWTSGAVQKYATMTRTPVGIETARRLQTSNNVDVARAHHGLQSAGAIPAAAMKPLAALDAAILNL